MASPVQHAVVPKEHMHDPYRWIVADDAERLALSVLSIDVGKWLRQTGDDTVWELISEGPAVWRKRGANADLGTSATANTSLTAAADSVPLSGVGGTIDNKWLSLQLRVPEFDSVADMVSDLTLVEGQKVKTLGYYTPGDGGGNSYVVQAAGTEAHDGGSCIDLAVHQARALFVNGVVWIEQFGADGGYSNDSTVAISNAMNFAMTVVERGRRYEVKAGKGKFKFSKIIIDNPAGEVGITQGRLKFSGAGEINTELVCTSATDDAIKLVSGRIKMSDFTLSSDGINRSKTVGSGRGIVIDATDGVTPETTTIAKFLLEDIQITGQPGIGLCGKNVELLRGTGITSDLNGGDGFEFDGSNNGGSVLGISDILVNCRAAGNSGRGLTINQVSEMTVINFQSLNNDAAEEVWSNGRGTVLINPDVESNTAALHDVGIELSGRNSKVIGGLAFGTTTGVKLAGKGQSVEGTHFANTGLAYDMEQAVDVSSATNYSVKIEESDPDVRKVLKAINPQAAQNGGAQHIGKYSELANISGFVREIAVNTADPFPLGDDGQAGSGITESSAYYINLNSNCNIQVPLISNTGQEFDLIFVQDGVGGHDVTLVGAQWKASISNTGNLANTVSSIRIRRHFDAVDSTVKYVQVGAQMPWL